MRDHTKLRAFELADEVAVLVYRKEPRTKTSARAIFNIQYSISITGARDEDFRFFNIHYSFTHNFSIFNLQFQCLCQRSQARPQDLLVILPYDERAARWHAEERARLAAQGQVPPYVDSQIAAIAKVNGLVLVTRNTSDFEMFSDLKVQNWHNFIM